MISQRQESAETKHITVVCSVLEIYNEKVKDLSVESGDDLTIREDSSAGGRGIHVEGLTEAESVQVKSGQEVLDCIAKAQQRRAVGKTNMNEHSSRSHSVVTLRIGACDCDDVDGATLTVSKLHLIDLAGSERQKATGATGDRLKEGAQINLSLSALGNVINALTEKTGSGGRHVPYRDSKLTRLLQDSLGGNSYTVIICNVSPAKINAEETLSSLRFAERAKKIENKAVVNRDPKGERILELLQENKALRAKVARLEAHIDRLEMKMALQRWQVAPIRYAEVDCARDKVLCNKEGAIYGMSVAMQSFFLSCNSRPGTVEELKEPFCLYGVVAALWVCARHGHAEKKSLLAHAKFLLGDVFRSALDFMEGSAWPVDSIDIWANDLGRTEFRLPPQLRTEYQKPASFQRQQEHPVEPVWEMGVHASLSAEPLQMWARILPVKLRHRNLIREQYPQWLPQKCETLYGHPKLKCDDVEDDITELFRERIPHSATSKDPVQDMGSLAAEFQKRFVAHQKREQKVDLFLCTIAYLCLLAEHLDKPIIGYFGHPLLFMVPDLKETREDFWQSFVGMARSRLCL
eukprot:s1907_g16.t1